MSAQKGALRAKLRTSNARDSHRRGSHFASAHYIRIGIFSLVFCASAIGLLPLNVDKLTVDLHNRTFIMILWWLAQQQQCGATLHTLEPRPASWYTRSLTLHISARKMIDTRTNWILYKVENCIKKLHFQVNAREAKRLREKIIIMQEKKVNLNVENVLFCLISSLHVNENCIKTYLENRRVENVKVYKGVRSISWCSRVEYILYIYR